MKPVLFVKRKTAYLPAIKDLPDLFHIGIPGASVKHCAVYFTMNYIEKFFGIFYIGCQGFGGNNMFPGICSFLKKINSYPWRSKNHHNVNFRIIKDYIITICGLCTNFPGNCPAFNFVNVESILNLEVLAVVQVINFPAKVVAASNQAGF